MEPVVLSYRVQPGDTFQDAAMIIFGLLRSAHETSPGAPRHLVLLIDGHRAGPRHRTPNGGEFDVDMVELQRGFIQKFLGQYFSKIEMPLRTYENQQNNDVPEILNFAGSFNERIWEVLESVGAPASEQKHFLWLFSNHYLSGTTPTAPFEYRFGPFVLGEFRDHWRLKFVPEASQTVANKQRLQAANASLSHIKGDNHG